MSTTTVAPTDADLKPSSHAVGLCVTIFHESAGKKPVAQILLTALGVVLIAPAFAFDVSVAFCKLMLWLNHHSRKLATVLARTGVFLPTLLLIVATGLVTYAIGPVKEMTRTIIEPVAAQTAPSESSAEGN